MPVSTTPATTRMASSKPKPKLPIYPRPVSPLSYEDSLCSTSESPIYHTGGSTTSDSDDELRAAKRRRIEALGEQYLRGDGLTILSAGLKGPLEGWKNPWVKRKRKDKRKLLSQSKRSLRSEDQEVPETVQRRATNVLDRKRTEIQSMEKASLVALDEPVRPRNGFVESRSRKEEGHHLSKTKPYFSPPRSISDVHRQTELSADAGPSFHWLKHGYSHTKLDTSPIQELAAKTDSRMFEITEGLPNIKTLVFQSQEARQLFAFISDPVKHHASADPQASKITPVPMGSLQPGQSSSVLPTNFEPSQSARPPQLDPMRARGKTPEAKRKSPYRIPPSTNLLEFEYRPVQEPSKSYSYLKGYDQASVQHNDVAKKPTHINFELSSDISAVSKKGANTEGSEASLENGPESTTTNIQAANFQDLVAERSEYIRGKDFEYAGADKQARESSDAYQDDAPDNVDTQLPIVDEVKQNTEQPEAVRGKHRENNATDLPAMKRPVSNNQRPGSSREKRMKDGIATIIGSGNAVITERTPFDRVVDTFVAIMTPIAPPLLSTKPSTSLENANKASHIRPLLQAPKLDSHSTTTVKILAERQDDEILCEPETSLFVSTQTALAVAEKRFQADLVTPRRPPSPQKESSVQKEAISPLIPRSKSGITPFSAFRSPDGSNFATPYQLNTQDIMGAIAPMEFSTAKKIAAKNDVKLVGGLISKAGLPERKNRPSFRPNPDSVSSSSSQASITSGLKVSKAISNKHPAKAENVQVPPSFGKKELDMETSDEDNRQLTKEGSMFLRARSLLHEGKYSKVVNLNNEVFAPTSSKAPPASTTMTSNSTTSVQQQDAQQVSNGLGPTSTDQVQDPEDFDLHEALDDLGTFLGSWDPEKEARSFANEHPRAVSATKQKSVFTKDH